ncbi:tetratricopeptide repeat protein [Helicobacter mesocricetorum]|uniref:tetratricopeptide repeat protein n=1 Tax=Helicobacter mesocricetorum TaxID=87012 RepID=UPI000CF08151|nr:tetratricopeptide repeat protein [Helicobacter mesocricetorum]
MFDKIAYCYFSADYEKCLSLSENFLKNHPKFALKYAMLSSFKLSLFQKSLYYAKELFELDPTSFNALMLSSSYIKNQMFEEALVLLQEFLKKDNDLKDEISLELAFLYKSTNQLKEAETIFKDLLQKDLYNLELWKHYVEIYFMHDFKKALKAHEELCSFIYDMIESLQKGLLTKKITTPIESNLQNRLSHSNKENLEILEVEDFLNAKILPQKAYLLFKLFNIPQALELFHSLEEFNQDHAQFWQNYAKVLEFSGNYQGAYNAYQKCLSLHQHATYQFDLAYLLMRMGVSENFEEGKKYYESRLFYAHNETFSAYHYNESRKAFNSSGVDAFKNKEVLVFCEQGFGDTIMYCRCLEKLCNIASKVLFAPQSAMYQMFKNQIKILNQNNSFKNLKVLKNFPTHFDYAIPICSLPLLIDIKFDEIPQLKTPIIPLKKPHNKKKKIGIFYFTPNAVNSDMARNFDFEFLFSALEGLECELISFQVGLNENLPDTIEDRAKKIETWEDTVKNLADIDCMISIDSAITHLTLALDIPTIVLLHPRFDWRWGKFEDPKSYFWSKARCFIFTEDTKANLKELVEKTLGI